MNGIFIVNVSHTNIVTLCTLYGDSLSTFTSHQVYTFIRFHFEMVKQLKSISCAMDICILNEIYIQRGRQMNVFSFCILE